MAHVVPVFFLLMNRRALRKGTLHRTGDGATARESFQPGQEALDAASPGSEKAGAEKQPALIR